MTIDISEAAVERMVHLVEVDPGYPPCEIGDMLRALRTALTAEESRLRYVIRALRREGFWAAIMSDEEIIKQLDEDIANGK